MEEAPHTLREIVIAHRAWLGLRPPLAVLELPFALARPVGWIADAAAKLTAFQNTASWQHSQLIAQGGWATMAGNKDPNTAVARMCAQQLVNRKT